MEFDNLITSPFGIGERLILELLRRGESVFAVYPTAKDVPMSFLGKKNIKYGFLRFEQDPILSKSLPRRVKHVFHLFDLHDAGLVKLFKANTLATLLLLDWAKGASVQTFTCLSSGEVYGSGENVTERASLQPSGYYAGTKHQAEMLLEFFRRAFRISIVRLFFPFGQGVDQGLIPDMARAIKAGEPFESRYSRVSPTFGDDVVDPLIAIRDQKEPGIYNICGSAVDVSAIAEKIGGVLGKPAKNVRPGNQVLCGDSGHARESASFNETPLDDGLKAAFSE